MNSFVLQLFDYFNTLILAYFISANAVYSVLMVISIYSVTLHSRLAARRGFADIADSPVTPPVAVIVPAHNEQGVIVQTVMAVLELDYPEKEIIVVDDGSTDETAERLIAAFELKRMDFIYREVVPAAHPPLAFYHNSRRPELLLVVKQNGGKSDALNVGINVCRSPYFCTVDADSIIERDALLRLMAPVVHSSENTVVSGGVVRIANGCTIQKGRIVKIDLPKTWLERCQVVEYIRTFLFGRPGWNFLQATFICSGAFCLLHRETVVQTGGFKRDTVTEDIDMIADMHEFLRRKKWKYRMVFTSDPVCWTEAPHTVSMLARQRRRWQLGLVQTVMKHNHFIGDPRYGRVGLFGMPFHAYIEALGCVIETFGLVFIPFSFMVGAMPFSLFLLLMFLAVGYGTLLSMGSVLLEETTLRRYPQMRHMLTLMGYAVIENFGYRQMTSFFRVQGVYQYLKGIRQWEVVTHAGFRGQVVTAKHEA